MRPLLLLLAALCWTPALHARQQPAAPAADARAVSATVRALLETLREAILHAPEPALGSRLRPLTYQFEALSLNRAAPTSAEDLARQVQALLDNVMQLRDDLRAEGQAVTAGRLDPLIEGLRGVLDTVREDAPRWRGSTRDGDEWESKSDGDEWQSNDDWDADDEWDADDTEDGGEAVDEGDDAGHTWHWGKRGHGDRWRHYRARALRTGDELFWGDALVRQDLPVRYNRVEGFYAGLRREPLDVDSRRPARLFGEIGYAFALEKPRYQIGLDLRVTPRGAYGAKVGGYYRRGTSTEDTWKADPVENALGAFFARHDAYDYYETEGWTAYGEALLGRLGRAQLGYRDEAHRSLNKNATWALFGGDPFRANPPADSGRAHSLVGTVEVGRVRGLTSLPRGSALRADVEWGQGLGGDFDFARLVAEGRLYVPTSRQTSLSLRLRGGSAFGDGVPFQKGFTLGGLGSVRAYPQNVFYGTRMVAANAEIAVEQPDLLDGLFDDLQLFGFADAGWTNGASNQFALDDAVGDLGFGVGLDSRRIRLELAWPLRDEGFGLGPTLWLRIAPPF